MKLNLYLFMRPFSILLLLAVSVNNLDGQTFTKKNLSIPNYPADFFSNTWMDFDNDGDLDVLTSFNIQFENLRNRKIEYKMKEPPLISTLGYSGLHTRNAWGDVDNDGDWDLLSPFYHDENRPRLYTNDGYGHFELEELSSLLGNGGANWVDINNDGWLDLFLTTQGGFPNGLYVNNGDGSFLPVEDEPVVQDSTRSGCASWADYDNDGDMDVFISNYWPYEEFKAQRNDFFINEGGSFVKMSDTCTLLSDTLGTICGNWADYDNDGDLDVYVTSIYATNHLYRNEGNGYFSQHVILPPEIETKAFHFSTWADLDNDGWLDLFVTSAYGHLDYDWNETNVLFHNLGDGSFQTITEGEILEDGGYDATAGDVDNDGDLDIFISWGFDTNTNNLYFNDGNDNHWITINCEGVISNRSAIGTRIMLKAVIDGEELWQMRELGSGNGNSPRFHFGLGDAEIIDSLVIKWPSGQIDYYTDLDPDQFLWAVEGESLVPNWAATSYIDLVGQIPRIELSEGESGSYDLSPYFTLVVGDTLPEISGDTILYTIYNNSNPDVAEVSFNEDDSLVVDALSPGRSYLTVLAYSNFTYIFSTVTIKVNSKPVNLIESGKTETNLRIYPNPATDRLWIEFENSFGSEKEILLFDLQGKPVYVQLSASRSVSIDLSDIDAGLYVLRIKNKEFVEEQKILIIK